MALKYRRVLMASCKEHQPFVRHIIHLIRCAFDLRHADFLHEQHSVRQPPYLVTFVCMGGQKIPFQPKYRVDR